MEGLIDAYKFVRRQGKARVPEAERSALAAARRRRRALERAVPDGHAYDPRFIRSQPIPARCFKCGYFWTGKDAIGSPLLRNCSCFFCHGELVPLDLDAYAERIASLHLHRIPEQPELDFGGCPVRA